MPVPMIHVLIFSLLLFAVGMIGVLTRRNAIIILMSIELMLNAANINFIAFSRQLNNLMGQVFGVFTIAVAAGEVAGASAANPSRIAGNARATPAVTDPARTAALIRRLIFPPDLMGITAPPAIERPPPLRTRSPSRRRVDWPGSTAFYVGPETPAS